MMGAAREQTQQMFGAENCRGKRKRRAVQRREKKLATWLEQGRASADHAGWVGHVFEHFHAGDDIERARHLGRERLDADQPIVDAKPALMQMQARDIEHSGREIDRGHLGASPRERFTEQTAAAANIKGPRAFQRRAIGDVTETDGIQVMQGARLAVGVPPARGEAVELGGFGRIDVGCGHGGITLRRCGHASAAQSRATRRYRGRSARGRAIFFRRRSRHR